jgi:hypothetical protein
MAAGAAVREALWMRKLMPSLFVNVETVKICGDNQGALKLMKNPIESARSKHIDVIHHLVRERVTRGEVKFEYCPTNQMVADCLTT